MDAGINTHPYPSYTTAQLIAFVAAGNGTAAMVAEIARRTAK